MTHSHVLQDLCCSVLQCVAVCCSVLQCVAVCCSVLQCAAVCCSVLQCVAVCCSVLQCVAVCCSVLQCVARLSTSLIHTCDMTYSRVWPDSFIRVTWLIHMCGMTYLFSNTRSHSLMLCMFVSLQFSAFWGKSNNESDGHILTSHVTSSRVMSHINESRHIFTSHVKFMNAETLPHHEREVGGWGRDPQKMYWERLGDGVEYHLMSPTPRR